MRKPPSRYEADIEFDQFVQQEREVDEDHLRLSSFHFSWRNPWQMIGGAVVFLFLLGLLTSVLAGVPAGRVVSLSGWGAGATVAQLTAIETQETALYQEEAQNGLGTSSIQALGANPVPGNSVTGGASSVSIEIADSNEERTSTALSRLLGNLTISQNSPLATWQSMETKAASDLYAVASVSNQDLQNEVSANTYEADVSSGLKTVAGELASLDAWRSVWKKEWINQ